MQKIQLYAMVGMVAMGAAVRADGALLSYAYAEQTITGLTLSGTGLASATLTGTATSASAAINGSGVATNDPFDTLQAYQGSAPPAPQNSYTKYSTAGGGTQAGDFSRGDAIISPIFATGASGSTVAESANSGAFGLMTGDATFLLTGTFTSTGNSISVGYNYSNDIVASATAPGSAEAKYSFLITVKDTHGHTVDASPAELNSTIGAPPTGPEIISSGSGTAVLSLAGLTAGDVFSITVTGQSATTAVNPSAVPEPGSAALLECGLGLLFLSRVFTQRRNAKNQRSGADSSIARA